MAGGGGCRRPTKRRLLGGLRRQVARGKTHPLGDANTVVRVGTVEMRNLPLDDLNRHAVHGRSYVFEKLLLLQRRHQAEQVAGLAVIVISIAMIVAVHMPDSLRGGSFKLGSCAEPPNELGS